MEDIKDNISRNISELRMLNNMTQSELAEELNYSDKSVSKWERGQAIPDITVLCKLSDIFNVPLDYLVKNVDIENISKEKINTNKKYNYRVIKYICESLVWFIALFSFVLTTLIIGEVRFAWLYFFYALPIVLIVSLIFNSIWFDRRKNYYIISGLIWSVLAVIQLTFFYFGIKIYPIYLLGIAGEIIIVLWSFLKPRTPKSK